MRRAASKPGQKEATLQEALAELEAAKAERERGEVEVQKELDEQFGELPGPEQPTPSGAQALEVVLQEMMAGVEEGQEGEADEATLPRDARGTTLINLDLSKLHMTTPEHREAASLVPVITLLPLQELTVVEEIPMAALPIEEQVAPEDAEMVKEGEIEE